MPSNYEKICSFGPVEFGYYESPDSGCVDEYKVVARYWDKDSCFLDEKILSYEDSPGEAVEVIDQYVKEGIVFESFYGKYSFTGGYKLVYSEGTYTPVLIKDKELTDF